MTATISQTGFISKRAKQRLIDTLRQKGIQNEAVLGAIADSPRHDFVEEALKSRAYEDKALPIGYRQTISQPYVVALMTEQLLGKQSRLRTVLEIGTGSGFQTSVLSKLVDRVYTIERVGPLFRRARKYFSEQGIDNIFLRHADGTAGWPTRRPFDGIIVTAATPQIPQALFAQLSEGGTLVAPEGAEGKQKLSTWKKIGRQFQHQSFEDVTFVPLVTGVEH